MGNEKNALSSRIRRLRKKGVLWTGVDYCRDAQGNLNPDPEPMVDTSLYLDTD